MSPPPFCFAFSASGSNRSGFPQSFYETFLLKTSGLSWVFALCCLRFSSFLSFSSIRCGNAERQGRPNYDHGRLDISDCKLAGDSFIARLLPLTHPKVEKIADSVLRRSYLGLMINVGERVIHDLRLSEVLLYHTS
jgi:hypothetical protein